MDIMLRGFHNNNKETNSRQLPKYPSGVYIIQPRRDLTVKTYCDFERDDGGWTMLAHTTNGKFLFNRGAARVLIYRVSS